MNYKRVKNKNREELQVLLLLRRFVWMLQCSEMEPFLCHQREKKQNMAEKAEYTGFSQKTFSLHSCRPLATICFDTVGHRLAPHMVTPTRSHELHEKSDWSAFMQSIKVQRVYSQFPFQLLSKGSEGPDLKDLGDVLCVISVQRPLEWGHRPSIFCYIEYMYLLNSTSFKSVTRFVLGCSNTYTPYNHMHQLKLGFWLKKSFFLHQGFVS